MTSNHHTRALWAALAVGLSLPTGPTQAEDYCVVCTSPSSMYRCEIKGTPQGRGTDPKAQLLCITEIATRGKHERCLVSKSAPVPCPGLLVTLEPPAQGGATVGDAHPPLRDDGTGKPMPETPVTPDPDAALAAGTAPDAPATGDKGSPAIAGAPKNDPGAPKTVEELAGKTVEATKDGISKAGSAVTGTAKKAGDAISGTAEKAGDAAKSTWKCIISLFGDC